MKIYTRTGDDGQTALIGGRRVSKADWRIDTYGTLDELNAWIGMLRDQPINEPKKPELIDIQNNLFVIGSLLAADPEHPIRRSLPTLPPDCVQWLEHQIDAMDAQLPPLRTFVLPGGHPSVSVGHVARTVCRRAERLVIGLHQQQPLDKGLLQYLNRLSDYLFVLCRWMAHELNITELPWKPNV